MPAVKKKSKRPQISKDFILEMKRTRIMDAASRVVCEKGIAGAKVADLTRVGGIGRKTFYEIFDGKDDCLQQTLSWIGERAHRHVVERLADRMAIGDRGRVRNGIDALLDFIAAELDPSRFYLLYGPSVSFPIFEAAQDSLGALLPLDQTTRTMVVGGLTQRLRGRFVAQPDADPRLLLNGLTDFVLSFEFDAAPRAVAA